MSCSHAYRLEYCTNPWFMALATLPIISTVDDS